MVIPAAIVENNLRLSCSASTVLGVFKSSPIRLSLISFAHCVFLSIFVSVAWFAPLWPLGPAFFFWVYGQVFGVILFGTCEGLIFCPLVCASSLLGWRISWPLRRVSGLSLPATTYFILVWDQRHWSITPFRPDFLGLRHDPGVWW